MVLLIMLDQSCFCRSWKLRLIPANIQWWLGGDFNHIRGPEDKSNDNINWPRVHLFSDCIANLALREIRRLGARFTWSNKQLNPIRSVLDRVLVSPEWEARFPLVTLTAETCIGSDHAPLILDSREGSLCRSSRFFFARFCGDG
jgi:endonuclease/exonuclease/phosphatase family metal-dependent hydrolase